MRIAFIVIIDDDKPAVILPAKDAFTAEDVKLLQAKAVADYTDAQIYHPVREGPYPGRV